MMKRTLSLLLVLVLAAALTACGGSTASADSSDTSGSTAPTITPTPATDSADTADAEDENADESVEENEDESESADNGSTSSAASAPEPGWAQARILVPDVDTALRMRAEPNTEADIVDRLVSSDTDLFYCLEEADGWGYGVFNGQLGWCSLDYMKAGDLSWFNGVSTIPLPDFLDKAQQLQFLRALSLLEFTYWDSGDLGGDSYEVAGTYPTTCYICPHCGGTLDSYLALVHELWDDALIARVTSVSRFVDHNGVLYVEEVDGIGNIRGQSLLGVSYTDAVVGTDSITFTMHCSHNNSEHEDEDYPIAMVKGSDGIWRCSQLATPNTGTMFQSP